MTTKAAFITGANGFIGSAVARKFSSKGWTTYGLIRHQRSALELMRNEIIPIVGLASDVAQWISRLPPIDVIITCDEDLSNYISHHQSRLAMIKQICKHSATLGNSVKPLVIFSSGCKDYGTTPMHGEVNLAPHTETSPLNPPEILRPRTEAAIDMLQGHGSDFDCVVTRPTTLFGLSGSFYSHFFVLASKAKTENDGVLELPANPNSVLHGTHVEDVAAAYFSLATAPREVVRGQSYNISGHRYETLEEIVPAIDKSHGIKVKYREYQESDAETFGLYVLALFRFPQWVGSEKIRTQLGWADTKPLFHKGYEVYRKAYEAAISQDSQQVERLLGKRAAGTL
ncbi:hypothetical protein PV10_02435 [Exophiala mesophila]|uniref:NAD-dependent epimerase/dehydratase domain-containing protein n=1 Tax=Exophiala mesophila TaxID=212818 RepID=A0A0D1WYX3_EXOME|nr:uncharacterized protein PV10_02435 [Exophiala mesophila]KIV94695.1 hypothetical protein PV10_02435 [Exophiala mesophila]